MKQHFVLLTSVFFFFFGGALLAQPAFISKGKIEFEKKENLHKMIDMQAEDWGENGSSWMEEIKKNTPQFSLTYFDLYFNEDKSLYKPGRENQDQKNNLFRQSPARENIVFIDLHHHTLTSQKNIFGSTFLIEDSARQVEWRITNENRDIAGFNCRKAVGKMLDSIYVVAFYTDQILACSGPESFNGLPGMILGIAIPRLNTTWFATRLELLPITDADLKAPVKGKKQSGEVFTKTLGELMKDWGKSGKRNMLQAII